MLQSLAFLIKRKCAFTFLVLKMGGLWKRMQELLLVFWLVKFDDKHLYDQQQIKMSPLPC